MAVRTAEAAGTCGVLLEDPELGEAIPPQRREAVASAYLARELRVAPGEWSGGAIGARDAIGMLVLDGLLVRRIRLEGRFAAELLSKGDLIRPWQGDAGALTLPLTEHWLALEPTRLAVLDERFARLLGRYPSLAARLLERAIRRSRHLTVHLAIIHQTRVDVRLHMLLWHLASRFGRVRGDGVLVPLRLTHAILAELVAARRPTVTTALATLAKDGRISLLGNAWLLSGEPPVELGPIGDHR